MNQKLMTCVVSVGETSTARRGRQGGREREGEREREREREKENGIRRSKIYTPKSKVEKYYHECIVIHKRFQD